MKNIKLIAGFSAALLFMGGLCLNVYLDSRDIQKRLVAAESTITTMKQEHDCAMQAAAAAMQAREREHERNQRKIAEAERALEGNADFGGILLPDDIARLFRKDGILAPDGSIPPACDAPGRH